MFNLFRQKRLRNYLHGADLYVSRTYIPCVPVADIPEETGGIRASRDSSPKFSRELDSIPKQGDAFQAGVVDQLLSSVEMQTMSLNQELNHVLDLSFVDMLIRYINLKGWRDSRVYKAAHMDRRLFSKIMSDRQYKPSKDTALSLVIGLELNLEQTADMLARAGYTLSHSNKRDVIIEYFIREGIYNMTEINDVLFRMDQKIIGR